MRQERNFRRSKDGIRWSKITFLRMKKDAWKQHPNFAFVLIERVRAGIDEDFGNGYTYGRIPNQAEEATK